MFKIYLQQCVLCTDCVYSMENLQTGTGLRKLIGSTVPQSLTAMLKAGTRCLAKVRAFILTLNWSAGTRPEKSVFATTGKVLFVDWCCNLNGKRLMYVSLTKKSKKSVWSFNKQCFVIFFLPYSLLRSIGSHIHSRHRQPDVPSYSRLWSSSNPNWSTLGLDYSIQGLTSECLRRHQKLRGSQATEASSCLERGELSRS